MRVNRKYVFTDIITILGLAITAKMVMPTAKMLKLEANMNYFKPLFLKGLLHHERENEQKSPGYFELITLLSPHTTANITAADSTPPYPFLHPMMTFTIKQIVIFNCAIRLMRVLIAVI